MSSKKFIFERIFKLKSARYKEVCIKNCLLYIDYRFTHETYSLNHSVRVKVEDVRYREVSLYSVNSQRQRCTTD